MPDFETEFILIRRMASIGQYTLAEERLRQILKQEPDSYTAHYMLAMTLIDQRRPKEALVEAKTALEINPLLYDAHFAAALANMDLGRLKEGIKHTETLCKIRPDSDEPYHMLGSIKQTQKKYKASIPFLLKALEIAPDNPNIHTDLGQAYKAAPNKMKEARECAQAALQLEPENKMALTLMGEVLLFEGQEEEALEHAKAALRSDPSYPDALALIGSIKTRRSPIMGVWWRIAVRIGELGPNKFFLLQAAIFSVCALTYWRAATMGYWWALAPIGAWILWFLFLRIGLAMWYRTIRNEIKNINLQDNY